MPKMKQPETLAQLCINNLRLIIKQLLSTVNDENKLSEATDCISSIMSTLPQTIGEIVSQEIFNTILETNYIKEIMNRENSSLDALITAFLHPQMRYLDVCKQSSNIGRAVWMSLPNLKCLKGLLIGKALLYKIPTPVEFSNQLAILICHYECTSTMIKELAKNCPALYKLDIRYSKGVLDTAVPTFLQMKNLCALQVERTGLTAKGCFQLLYKLTTLYKFYSHFCLIKMLQAIHGERHYPNLTEVSIRRPIRRLLPLRKLRYLTRLHISVAHYRDISLKRAIKECGRNLHTLYLDQVLSISILDIVTCCPNLKTLCFLKCTFRADYDWDPSLPHFTSVEELTCECLLNSFHNYPFLCYTNLTYIKCSFITDLTNEFLKEALSQGWLKHIRTARFRQCGSLSIPILDSLLTSCDELSVVGDINEWYGVTPDIIELVQNNIKLHNYDLTLL